MKSKLFNLLNESALVFLFSVAVYTLFLPWLHPLSRVFGSSQALPFLPAWVLTVVALSAFLSRPLGALDRRPRFFLLAFYLGINLLLLYVLGWSLFIYLPAALMLTLFGLRFRLYFTVVDVKRDIALGVLILFFNLAISTATSYTFSFAEIILFLLAAIGLGVFFNLRSLESRGFDPQYRFAFLLLTVSAVVIFSLAFFIGLPLEGGLLQAFIDGMRRVYLFFANIFSWILYGLVWILRPLFNFIENLELTSPERQSEQEGRSFTDSFEDINENVPQSEGVETPIAPYIFWGLLCLVLIVILILLVRKLAHKWGKKGDGEGVVQESESVFSFSKLGSRARDRWSSLREALFRGNLTWLQDRYGGADPLTRIRLMYFRFSWNLKDFLPFRISDTPRDYLDRLRDKEELAGIEAEINELTELYNRARYGKWADDEDARRAKALWEQIRDEIRAEEGEED